MNLARRRFLRLARGASALPALSRFVSALAYPTRPVLLLGLAAAGLGSRPGSAEEPAPSSEASLARAVGVLTHEKSAAEQYAVILATAGRSDTALYLRGIALYADAKAEFDALIAELKFDLTTGQDPAHSAVFTSALQGAAEKRIAFTSFVSREVVDKLSGAKPGLPDVIGAVPELVKTITDSGLTIWKAFHDAGKERRATILSEVDQLQWRSFADLART
jgi:hypothetical protein